MRVSAGMAAARAACIYRSAAVYLRRSLHSSLKKLGKVVKMRYRVITLVLGLSLAAISVSGCSGKLNSGRPETEARVQTEPQSIEVLDMEVVSETEKTAQAALAKDGSAPADEQETAPDETAAREQPEENLPVGRIWQGITALHEEKENAGEQTNPPETEEKTAIPGSDEEEVLILEEDITGQAEEPAEAGSETAEEPGSGISESAGEIKTAEAQNGFSENPDEPETAEDAIIEVINEDGTVTGFEEESESEPEFESKSESGTMEESGEEPESEDESESESESETEIMEESGEEPGSEDESESESESETEIMEEFGEEPESEDESESESESETEIMEESGEEPESENESESESESETETMEESGEEPESGSESEPESEEKSEAVEESEEEPESEDESESETETIEGSGEEPESGDESDEEEPESGNESESESEPESEDESESEEESESESESESEEEPESESESQEPGFQLGTSIDRVNVRSDASTESESKALLRPGSKIIILENREDGWSMVKYESDQGIDAGYVKTEYLLSADHLRIAAANVNVRSGPDSDSEDNKIGKFEGGEEIPVLDEENGWSQIAFERDGAVETAYVKSEFLAEYNYLDSDSAIISEYKNMLEGEGLDAEELIKESVGETEAHQETEASVTDNGLPAWPKDPVAAQFALARWLVPDLRTVGVIYTRGNQETRDLVKVYKDTAQDYDMELVEAAVTELEDIDFAAAELVGNVYGILLIDDETVNSAVNVVTAYADEVGIPVIGFNEEQVKNGCAAAVDNGTVYFSRGELDKLGISLDVEPSAVE